MFDALPYPQLSGKTTEEQLVSMYKYLLLLKESLEFELDNIEKITNSPEIKQLKNEIIANSKVTIAVNYQTGNLEYEYPT